MSSLLSYRLGALALRDAPVVRTSVLYAIGGMYGNFTALDYIRSRARSEAQPVHLIFNGDFNFFNATPQWWLALNESIRSSELHVPIAGNVEVESSSDAEFLQGCGCGYPKYVPSVFIERSDSIVGRLHATARAANAPHLISWMRALPKALIAEVGAQRRRVGIVHGDVESLSGWQLGVEAMEPPDAKLRKSLGCDEASSSFAFLPTTPRDKVLSWFAKAEVDGILSTHTCLPYGQILSESNGHSIGGGGKDESNKQFAIFNNGSAGMPNFEGTRFGLITRVSDDPTPPSDSLYGGIAGGLRYDALPVRYDDWKWMEQFRAVWPEGSDAHLSYYARLVNGPRGFTLGNAARQGVQLQPEGVMVACSVTGSSYNF